MALYHGNLGLKQAGQVWVLGIKLRFSEKHQLFSITELSLQPKAISFYFEGLPCQVWDTGGSDAFYPEVLT